MRFSAFACCVSAIAVVTLSGCGQSASVVPTAPTLPEVSRPTAPAPPPSLTVTGEIRIGAVTHPTGSTLAVQDCGPGTGIAGHHLCNEEWRGAFDVVVDRDLTEAVLTVTFAEGEQRCGVIYVIGQNFGAGRERLVSTSTPLYLTYEPEGYENLAVTQYCTLPRTTTRLIVELWRGSAAVPLLRRAFDYSYRFEARADVSAKVTCTAALTPTGAITFAFPDLVRRCVSWGRSAAS